MCDLGVSYGYATASSEAANYQNQAQAGCTDSRTSEQIMVDMIRDDLGVTIKKSYADAIGFEQAVKDYIAALEAHCHHGNAAPVAIQVVEEAVKRMSGPLRSAKPPLPT